IVFPRWTYTIKKIQEINKFVAVSAVITIDGISREGLGTGAADSETGIKKAEHDALKRAAVKFGIGRDLREKDENANQNQNSNKNRQYPTNVAQINPNLATNDQLKKLSDLQIELNRKFGLKLHAPSDIKAKFGTIIGDAKTPRTVTKLQCEEVFKEYNTVLEERLKTKSDPTQATA
ncbi:MAG TPA: Rad52/Rad22 family DNA repair protein, partial [Pyrinomonadaceae bacterium]|nr:Rad52/Rad22 family DNA repair protein [Pyrinomonadaceae bacterium]